MEKEFDLSMCRIIVDNAEQSKKLQELAFKQGFSWGLLGKTVTNTYARVLYFNVKNSRITFSSLDHDNSSFNTFHFTDVFKETLQEKALRLENELNEVKQQIEEENNIKIGDWVKRTYRGIEIFKADHTHDYRYINSEQHIYQKITNTELIKLLEQEIK